jgi:hypothetical protein
VKHRVHPDYAGRINLPPSAGLFADSAGGVSQRPAQLAPASGLRDEQQQGQQQQQQQVQVEEVEEEDAFWQVGVVATSHLLNSSSAAR